jgi:hypothetical protein
MRTINIGVREIHLEAVYCFKPYRDVQWRSIMNIALCVSGSRHNFLTRRINVSCCRVLCIMQFIFCTWVGKWLTKVSNVTTITETSVAEVLHSDAGPAGCPSSEHWDHAQLWVPCVNSLIGSASPTLNSVPLIGNRPWGRWSRQLKDWGCGNMLPGQGYHLILT